MSDSRSDGACPEARAVTQLAWPWVLVALPVADRRCCVGSSDLTAVPMTNLKNADEALSAAKQQRLDRTSKLAMAELLEGLGDAPKNAELAEAVARGVPLALIEEALQQNRGFETLASLRLPRKLRALCKGVDESQFRSDLSSTALRANKG